MKVSCTDPRLGCAACAAPRVRASGNAPPVRGGVRRLRVPSRAVRKRDRRERVGWGGRADNTGRVCPLNLTDVCPAPVFLRAA
ncbi:hypothetical protein GCM10008960_27610 [Deinococcus sedimenti]|uniref:Uncharacterized protein n=1 Tax=Deinococcus sedimenti TaxID=1867090 RepID=A0ABQ2S8L1_9DEIO|nr:hypothetical protein GCM10008960_27610 [Deinococcus sedimenti]